MILAIYERDGKRWGDFTDDLSKDLEVITEDLNKVVLSENDVIDRFEINGWDDFWSSRKDLLNYKLQIFVAKLTNDGKPKIGLSVFLLNNPLIEVLLCENIDQGDIEKTDHEFFEVKTIKDFFEAEKLFGFEHEVKYEIFAGELAHA